MEVYKCETMDRVVKRWKLTRAKLNVAETWHFIVRSFFCVGIKLYFIVVKYLEVF